MWCRTRLATRAVNARGARRPSSQAVASSAPTASWPTKWPSANVAGLPMSWRSAATRASGRPSRAPGAAASTVRQVWSQRSSPGTLAWGIPRWRASSGAMTARRPVSSASRRPVDGPLGREQPHELGEGPLAGDVGGQRRLGRDRRRASRARRRSPSVAAKRTARSIRRASSRKRAPGSPTARSMPAARSSRPPKRSTRSPGRPVRVERDRHRVDGEVAAGEVVRRACRRR